MSQMCQSQKNSVSVREQVESSESFVIQVWWPDSRRVTDVDGEEPQTIRPQRTTISERSDRRRMGACGVVDPAGQARGAQGPRRRARGDERDHVCVEYGFPGVETSGK